MIPKAHSSDSLLVIVSENGLYPDLLSQIKKDFELSGLSISINKNISVDELLLDLYKQIRQLIEINFSGYLQLLYRVDVPENMMQSPEVQYIDEFSKKATFLILNREWEKVYYRANY
jgi:hypothetical protein